MFEGRVGWCVCVGGGGGVGEGEGGGGGGSGVLFSLCMDLGSQ